MGEHNSPMFARGVEDGEADAQLVASCPPGIPIGPNPPEPAYPRMYLRGYERAFSAAVPHNCTANCWEES